VSEQMSEIEVLATKIGELVYMEIEEADSVGYSKDKDKLTAFIIQMQSGKRYSLAIKEVA